MPYFIETFDKENSQHIRNEHRPAHMDYLTAHQEMLLACGAKLADESDEASGGVYLLDVETRAEAEAFIVADPLSRADLFADIQIMKWRKGFLNGKRYV